MIDIDQQGWESPKHQYRLQTDKILITKCKKNIANSILKQNHHSLQPDMINGWKPKIPSYPLPLSYYNLYNQKLMEIIPKDDRFKIVFIGQRYINSVQINQQYSYFWKYRQRYSLNLALVQQAVKKIGMETIRSNEKISAQLTQKQLKFDSSFESGNLQMSVKVKPNQYDLFLRSDTNTKGHTNWYYFKVNNKDLIGSVQFNICNLGKTKALYNKGMKPYVYQNSQQKQISNQLKFKQQSWSQDKTHDVCFVQRYCRYGTDKKTFQLQFKYQFKKPNTQVYFAYGIPYTYSQLQQYIKNITSKYNGLIKSQKLCQSLGGLSLPLLTISSEDYIKENNISSQCNQNINSMNSTIDMKINNHSSQNCKNQNRSLKNHHSYQQSQNLQKKQRKAVLITARIHPGQSNSSYVLQGFIDQLLSDGQIANKIRQKYVFYIVPMLNPDGVVAGNFRTSYSGKDLNRQFKKLDKFVYPQIFALDQLSINLKLKHKRKLEFYFDFHGHSSKKNLFCYGPEHQPSNILFFKCRTFAKIMEQINPIFSYRKSIFHISQNKRTTARAHMLWNHRIPMTYTFQISNGLYQNKQQKNIQLDTKSMKLAGKTVYQGFQKYVLLQSKNFGYYNAKAKVDTGIRSRKFFSDKSIRQRSLKIERIYSSKPAVQSGEVLVYKKSLELKNPDTLSNGFQKYIKQIKQQSIINSQVQGGSDSQGSQDDLSNQQLFKLHEFVKDRTKQAVKDIKQKNQRVYNFKIKPIRIKKQMKQRKLSIQQTLVDQLNKQNIRSQNIKIPSLRCSSSGIDSARRLYKQLKKIPNIKKPPLPIPIIYQKVVLCQKKFTVDF